MIKNVNLGLNTHVQSVMTSVVNNFIILASPLLFIGNIYMILMSH